MKPFITVFTPAFNRESTLPRTYESLIKQSNKSFIWLIVDDGSTDSTSSMVENWKHNNNGFEIRYIYKKNGGMHTAHNLAYDTIDTELNICIDSDDMLASDAIQVIYHTWEKVKAIGCAGIIGLDADMNGHVIGTKFKIEGITKYCSFYSNGGVGDKKLVYRTDVMRMIRPYPEFEGEKLVPLSYKYILCDQYYNIYAINRVLCNVEYQTDGSTNTIKRQYVTSPHGFAEFRKIRMQHPLSSMGLLKDTIHYIANSFMINNKNYIKESPKKFLTMLFTPIGYTFYRYLVSTYK